MRVRKPWTQWDDSIDPGSIPGAMGIFEIADAERRTLYIGRAGGASPFGIRGELYRHLSSAETNTRGFASGEYVQQENVYVTRLLKAQAKDCGVNDFASAGGERVHECLKCLWVA